MVSADIQRITDGESSAKPIRFNAEIRVTCEQCKTPFRFIGLPAGVDLNGAAVSVDGEEGRFAIAPKGEVVNEIEGGPVGFTVRKVK